MITIQKSQLSVMNIQYRYFSLDKFLDDAVGNGVSNIELWGAMPFFNIEDMTYQEVKEVRHQIESRGLKLVCLTPEQCVYPVNLAAPSEAARRRSLKFFEDNIRAASELGTDKMLVTTGYGFFDESNHEEAWKWARDGIYDLAELAKIHGITLALEVLRRDESNLVYNLPTLSQMLDELKAQESILNGMSVTIGMGSMVNTAGSIKKSFLDAVFMIKQRLLLGTGRMLEMDEAQQRKNSDFINSEAFYRFNREMERAVEALNVVETRRTIEGLRDVLKNYPGITGYEILQMTKEACNHYLFCMKSRGIRVDSEAKFVEEFSKDAGECADIEELFRLLGGTIGRSLQKASEAKKAEDNRPIRQAKQYIEENYSRSLTLEEVSEMAGFAPGYFSTLFKKETGVTFLEFLQSVRMDAAKKLLVSGNEGMNVICEKVGYADVKYFTKCFIKYTGLKPGEYRKIYS